MLFFVCSRWWNRMQALPVIVLNMRSFFKISNTPTGVCEHEPVQPDRLPGQPAQEHQHEVPHPGQGPVRRVWVHGSQPLC